MGQSEVNKESFLWSAQWCTHRLQNGRHVSGLFKNTIYSITYTTSSILCSFNFMHSKDSKICCTTICHFSCQQTSKEQVCTMSSTPPCPTQTDGRASVHDPTPNFRAPRTSMPTFSLLLQQCDRVLCSHLEVSKASKLWSWCKMEPDGHYYPTRDSFHFSNPTRKAAKEQIERL